MRVRTVLLLAFLSSTAQAAPFDDLKDDLSTCLRFEMTGSQPADGARASRAGYALQRCAVELDRLERADPRRTRADGGLSPSTRAVIQSVLGQGGRGRYTGLRN